MNKQLDLKKPVQTRDGRKVDILCTDLKGPCPIVARVTNDSGVQSIEYYHEFGLWCPRFCLTPKPSTWDLVNTPEKLIGFVNVYRDRYGRTRIGNFAHPSAGHAHASIRKWANIEPLGVLDLSKLELLQP